MSAFRPRQTFPLAYQAVAEKAPAESGVYAIQTAQQWVHIGEADDIRHDLFRHLNAPMPCMRPAGALLFSFETIAPPERMARRQALIVELAPVCHPRVADK